MLKMPAVNSSKSAFTLVEMMTAIAILAILTAIIFSIMGMALRVTDSTTRGGDTAIEARQVLDRIGQDISGMLIRPDVDQYYVKAVGNDQMFFYSQTAGYFDSTTPFDQESPVSLVGYRISWSVNTTTPPVLQRLAQGLNWSGAKALTFLTFPPPAFPPRVPSSPAYTASSGTIPVQWNSLVTDPDTAPSFWSTTGSQVFRLEIVYQLRDGTFTLTPPTPATPPAITTTTTQPLPPVPGSINDTVGIVVAIAVLDNKSRQIVPAASWGQLISALHDPVASDLTASPAVLMDSTWNTALNQPSFAATEGIPVTAASQIRVYQRYYPLNAPKFQ
jgi:prepilin-type N-terminal cleavage/methylation domain-containing protein